MNTNSSDTTAEPPMDPEEYARLLRWAEAEAECPYIGVGGLLVDLGMYKAPDLAPNSGAEPEEDKEEDK